MKEKEEWKESETAQRRQQRAGGEVRRKERCKRRRVRTNKRSKLFLHAARQRSVVTEGC